jgi:hypothetical protein
VLGATISGAGCPSAAAASCRAGNVKPPGTAITPPAPPRSTGYRGISVTGGVLYRASLGLGGGSSPRSRNSRSIPSTRARTRCRWAGGHERYNMRSSARRPRSAATRFSFSRSVAFLPALPLDLNAAGVPLTTISTFPLPHLDRARFIGLPQPVSPNHRDAVLGGAQPRPR